ncbi:MAG: co-chaperone GroES [Candidatus Moranbacteria bacterium]|nr:co-chaperone GroES [Candidatus Moranbacteria bacterium]
MKKENIQPLGENILVKPMEAETKTKSGIVIPETAKEDRPQQGKVMAVGDDKKIKVKKGQIVIFAKYGGTEIKVAGQEYLIVKNEDILAVVK